MLRQQTKKAFASKAAAVVVHVPSQNLTLFPKYLLARSIFWDVTASCSD